MALIGLAVVSGIVGAAITRAVDDDNDRAGEVPESLLPATSPAANDSPGQSAPDEPLSKAAAAVLPGVVSVTAEGRVGTGQGSGVVLSRDGLVLTNNHVVVGAGEGADLSVTLPDGSTKGAELVGRDPATDLAVVRVDDVDDLTAAKLGSSSDLHVGDTVLAIGSPLGLDGSVSSGIVSALDRAITLGDPEPQQSPFDNGESSSPVAVIDAIQTDAAINPGNSGGALANADGEVVGINTAIASLAQGFNGESGNIGVGFAIPIDDAKGIAEQLIADGEVEHAYLGVRLTDATQSQQGSGSGDDDGDGGSGAVVAGVEAGSPADDAGVERGDVLVSIDDETVRDAATVTAAIRRHDPDDEVKIVVRRNGEEKTLTAKLGTFPTATN